jgi:site-specific DNA-adenine methylase
MVEAPLSRSRATRHQEKRIKIYPLFRYAGSKAEMLDRYHPCFAGLHPQYCIDYFGGSGTMSLFFHAMYPTARLLLHEKDSSLVYLFTAIQQHYDQFVALMEALDTAGQRYPTIEAKNQWYRDWQKEVYNAFPEYINTIAWSAIFTLLRTYSFNGFNIRRHGKYMTGAGVRGKASRPFHRQAVEDFHTMLQQTTLCSMDYRILAELIPVWEQIPCVLHYFDPPYIDTGKNIFPDEFPWEQTETLCRLACALAQHNSVFLSNIWDERLAEMLPGFTIQQFPGVSGVYHKHNTKRIEALYYSRHPAMLLHDTASHDGLPVKCSLDSTDTGRNTISLSVSHR